MYRFIVIVLKFIKIVMKDVYKRQAKCIDNGPMEGFWGILKRERYYGKRFTDRGTLVKICLLYTSPSFVPQGYLLRFSGVSQKKRSSYPVSYTHLSLYMVCPSLRRIKKFPVVTLLPVFRKFMPVLIVKIGRASCRERV